MPLNDAIADAQVSALRKELYTGQLNDMTVQWLKAELAVGSDLMSLWKSFFNIKGIAGTQHNQRMQNWLTLEGHQRETLADSQLSYWKNRANV